MFDQFVSVCFDCDAFPEYLQCGDGNAAFVLTLLCAEKDHRGFSPPFSAIEDAAHMTNVRNETTDPSTLPRSPLAVTLHVYRKQNTYYPVCQTARAGLWASVTLDFLGRGERGRRATNHI